MGVSIKQGQVEFLDSEPGKGRGAYDQTPPKLGRGLELLLGATWGAGSKWNLLNKEGRTEGEDSKLLIRPGTQIDVP